MRRMRIRANIMRTIYQTMYRTIYRNERSIGGGVSQKKRMNLEWWRQESNIGDALSPVIYAWMCRKLELNREKSLPHTRHLMGLGSILGMGEFDACVWGSGIHCEECAQCVIAQKNFRKYDIRAVRGPFTRFILQAAGYVCPTVYGDPGVLMPLIYRPPAGKARHTVTLIRHYTMQQEDFQSKGLGLGNLDESINLLDTRTADYRRFIDEITASKRVISSSLHGIILAESYGIPAVFLSQGIEKERMKFLDWYFSTGRYELKAADCVESALCMEPVKLPGEETVKSMQKALMESFPKDLWEENGER